MSGLQTAFGFFEAGCNRSGVLKANLFRPEKIRVFNDGHEGVSGGQRQEIAYLNWLKFFTPLSHTQEFSL